MSARSKFFWWHVALVWVVGGDSLFEAFWRHAVDLRLGRKFKWRKVRLIQEYETKFLC